MACSRTVDETGCSSRKLTPPIGQASNQLLSQRALDSRTTPRDMITARNDNGILEVIEALMELPQSPISKTSTKRPVREENASRVCQPRLALVNEIPTLYVSSQFHGALPATPAADDTLMTKRYLPPIESRDHMRMSPNALVASTDHCADVRFDAGYKYAAYSNYSVSPNMPDARAHVDIETLESRPTFFLDCEGYGLRQPHYHVPAERSRTDYYSRSPVYAKACRLQEAPGADVRQSLSTLRRAVAVKVAPCHLDFHAAVDEARCTMSPGNAGAASKQTDAGLHRRTEKILEHRDCKPVNGNLEPWKARTSCDLKNDDLDGEPIALEQHDARNAQVATEYYLEPSTYSPHPYRRIPVVEPETEDDRSCAMFAPASGVVVNSLLSMDDGGSGKFRSVYATDASNSSRAAHRQVSPEPPFGVHVTESHCSNMINRCATDPKSTTPKNKRDCAEWLSQGVFQQASSQIPQRRTVQSRALSTLGEQSAATLAQQTRQGTLPSPSHTPVTLAENLCVAAIQKRAEAAESPGTVPSARMRKCNCRNSRCLKLYCDCFAGGKLCDGCNCVNCHNTESLVVERQRAIQDILEKNPRAFDRKITSANSHSSGCHCKKSRCLKRYCECFQNSIHCGLRCKCSHCENYPGSTLLAQRRESLLLINAQEVLIPKIDVLSPGVMPCANLTYTGCV